MTCPFESHAISRAREFPDFDRSIDSTPPPTPSIFSVSSFASRERNQRALLIFRAAMAKDEEEAEICLGFTEKEMEQARKEAAEEAVAGVALPHPMRPMSARMLGLRRPAPGSSQRPPAKKNS